jgi:tetratricopeptide (TPR) repeat protein
MEQGMTKITRQIAALVLGTAFTIAANLTAGAEGAPVPVRKPPPAATAPPPAAAQQQALPPPQFEGCTVPPTGANVDIWTKVFAACDALIKAGAGTPQALSADYLARGMAWFAKNDPDVLPQPTLPQAAANIEQAIADLSEAIKLDPNNVAAYVDRAVMDLSRHEYDILFPTSSLSDFNGFMANLAASVADSTAAINIDPKFALAYVNRAGAQMYKLNTIAVLGPGSLTPIAGVGPPDPADLDSAIADYGGAIAITPYVQPQGLLTTWLGSQVCCNLYAVGMNVYAMRADAYSDRISSSKDWGNVDATMADLNSEIADYTDAIRIEPQASTLGATYYHKRGDAYLARAQLFDGKNDVPHAIADYQAAVADYTKSQSLAPKIDVGANLTQAQNGVATDQVSPADLVSQCNKCVADCEARLHQCPTLSAAQTSPLPAIWASFCLPLYKVCLGAPPSCSITGRSAAIACSTVVPGIGSYADGGPTPPGGAPPPAAQ